MHLRVLLRIAVLPLAALLVQGCSKSAPPAPAAGAAPARTPVILQTDWYAQAEHGGYYQALARGFYAEAGLDAQVLQGGPGAFVTQKVAAGQVQFGMSRSDEILLAVRQGLPLVIVSALMQHDPQALLLHEENPVSRFEDLDGQAIMATPGAAWVELLQRRYNIRLRLIPLNYGLAQFMADKSFIQQCFITNEPYYVRQNGGNPKTLLLADSGFDPYRVIFTSRRFLRENPAAVRAFVEQSIRGWDDFLTGDATPGKNLILSVNDKMSDGFLDYSIAAMNRYGLVSGRPGSGDRTGLLRPERLQAQVDALVSIGLLAEPIPLDAFVSFDFQPGG